MLFAVAQVPFSFFLSLAFFSSTIVIPFPNFPLEESRVGYLVRVQALLNGKPLFTD